MRRFFHFLRRIAYSLYFYFLMLTILNAYYFWGKLRGFKDSETWRLLGLRAVSHILEFARIRINVKGRENIPSGSVIFCANHQSYLDGLIIFYVTQQPFVALTAPYEIFPGTIERWFRKMGYVGVARDVFEELKYKDAVGREQAVAQSIGWLTKGVSLLLFPEGTRERKKRLLPFHAGIGKISHESRRAVVPITLKNIDALFPSTSIWLNPVPVGVIIDKPVKLWEISSDYIEDAKYIEATIQKHLPKRYFTEKSVPHLPTGCRAAFFDLDGTLTRKNVYQLAVTQYMRRHMDMQEMERVLLLLYKKVLLKHGMFYQYAIHQLRGIVADDFIDGFDAYLAAHADEIFYKQMREVLEQHRAEENKIFIISEEPDIIGKRAAALLNVKGFGTSLEVVGGKFTGRIRGHIAKDEVKKDLILQLAQKHHIDVRKSYAYGNTWHDYPMLRVVGHATLIRPPHALAQKGEKLGFRVVHSLE